MRYLGFGLWRKGQKEKALCDREDIQITYVRATLGHPLADRYLWSVYPHFCWIAINRKKLRTGGRTLFAPTSGGYIRAVFKPKVYAMSLHGAKGWRKGER